MFTCLRIARRLIGYNVPALRHMAASTSEGPASTTQETKEVFRPRQDFTVPKKYDFRVWFPMHMGVQMEKMQGKLRSVDLIVEVILCCAIAALRCDAPSWALGCTKTLEFRYTMRV